MRNKFATSVLCSSPPAPPHQFLDPLMRQVLNFSSNEMTVMLGGIDADVVVVVVVVVVVDVDVDGVSNRALKAESIFKIFIRLTQDFENWY